MDSPFQQRQPLTRGVKFYITAMFKRALCREGSQDLLPDSNSDGTLNFPQDVFSMTRNQGIVWTKAQTSAACHTVVTAFIPIAQRHSLCHHVTPV